MLPDPTLSFIEVGTRLSSHSLFMQNRYPLKISERILLSIYNLLIIAYPRSQVVFFRFGSNNVIKIPTLRLESDHNVFSFAAHNI